MPDVFTVFLNKDDDDDDDDGLSFIHVIFSYFAHYLT